MGKTLFSVLAVAVVLATVLLFTVGITGPSDDAVRAGITGETVDVHETDSNEEEEVQESPSEEVVNAKTGSFGFEGFGPGKSHLGTFDEWDARLYLSEGEIAGFEGVVDATSVNTGIGGLDKHLKSADFFNVEIHPTITFVGNIQAEQMVGGLTFLGVTKEINFPITKEEGKISADFILDTKEFGLNNAAANSEVRIEFSLTK
tara:strand:- start:4247 stop:4855 length:609 start_codon:yes stop_codon:yes gene_type:complete